MQAPFSAEGFRFHDSFRGKEAFMIIHLIKARRSKEYAYHVNVLVSFSDMKIAHYYLNLDCEIIVIAAVSHKRGKRK